MNEYGQSMLVSIAVSAIISFTLTLLGLSAYAVLVDYR